MAKYKRIDTVAEPDELTPLAEDKVISGSPKGGSVNQVTNSKENFFVGTWQSDEGKWKFSYTEDEFFTILEGEAIMTEEGGEPQSLKPGDHMTVAAGFIGTWETIGRVKKLYVIYED
ncbi:MAG: cupin domain-containing protein [Emcibacteraceae bacterium]|nr:cupin domain-containing protein [Emcibacteraceae bacterium]MDG1858843.1 cupin domain-containing protein [Emcibacteraceae bacterium]